MDKIMEYMSTDALVVMLSVWGIVIIGILYCYTKLLSRQRPPNGEDPENSVRSDPL